jgi:hypothetical protein
MVGMAKPIAKSIAKLVKLFMPKWQRAQFSLGTLLEASQKMLRTWDGNSP